MAKGKNYDISLRDRTCSVYGTSYEHGWRSRLTHYKNNDTREDTVGPQNGLANNWRVTRAKKSARNDTSIEGSLALERKTNAILRFDAQCLATLHSNSYECVHCSEQHLSTNPLPINLNLHPSQIHIPRSTRLLHSRRQPVLRLLVVKRPLRHDEEESERRAAEADVEGFVDILGGEADDDGEDAGCDEEEGGEEVGERLAAEVLCCG